MTGARSRCRRRRLPVMRFVVTPPATAPLADLGGLRCSTISPGRQAARVCRSQNPESARSTLYVRELDGLEARPIPGTEVHGSRRHESVLLSQTASGSAFGIARRGIMRVMRRRRAAAQDARRAPRGLSGGRARAADDTIDPVVGAAFSLQRGRRPPAAARLSRCTPESQARRRRSTLRTPRCCPGERAVLFSRRQRRRRGARRPCSISRRASRRVLVDGGREPRLRRRRATSSSRAGTTLMAAPFDVGPSSPSTGEPVATAAGGPADQRGRLWLPPATLVYVPFSFQFTPGC